MQRLSGFYIKNRQKINYILIITACFLLTEMSFTIFPSMEVNLWEQRITDYFFRLRYALKGQEEISPYIATISLQPSDLNNTKIPDADNPLLYAALLEKLYLLEAGSIGVDILFTGRGSAESKEALSRITNLSGNIHYPVIPLTEKAPMDDEPYGEEKLYQNIKVKKAGTVPAAENLLLPFRKLVESGAGLGHIRYVPGEDGIARELPLFYLHQGQYIPSLALRIICHYLKVLPENMEMEAGKYLVLKEASYGSGFKKDIKIPIDMSGQMLLNFSGPDVNRFQNYSFTEILNSGNTGELKNYLEESILFIFDNTIAAKDQGTGIYHQKFPLIQLQVEAVNMILKNNFLYEYTYWQKFLWKLLPCLLLWLIAGKKKGWQFIVSGTALTAGLLGTNILLFLFAGRIPWLLNPAACTMLSATAAGFCRYSQRIKDAYRKQKMEQQKLEQANKLITLGTMVSSIAHEVANPNNAIMLEADYLEESTAGIEELSQLLEELQVQSALLRPHWAENLKLSIQGIKESSKKIAKIVAELKNFYKEGIREKHEPVDINKIIQSSLYILSHPLKLQAIVHFKSCDGEKTTVLGNPGQIEQVIVNILTNSIHALAGRKAELSRGNIHITTTGDKTDRIKVIITDDGAGMDAETLKKADAPFFSTKQDQGGTGLGLYIVNKIMDQHGGELQIESEMNRGTTVTLSFPQANREDFL